MNETTAPAASPSLPGPSPESPPAPQAIAPAEGGAHGVAPEPVRSPPPTPVPAPSPLPSAPLPPLETVDVADVPSRVRDEPAVSGADAPPAPAPADPAAAERGDRMAPPPGTPAAAGDSGASSPGTSDGTEEAPAASPAAGPAAAQAEPVAPAATPAPTREPDALPPPKIGVEVRFIDFAGQPIADLQHKVVWTEKGKKIELPGKTDARGQGLRIHSMAMHTRFELLVRKDDGSYVVKHQGVVACEDLSLCVVSPHIRIQVETELHAGSPGALPPKPAARDPRVEQRPNAPQGRAGNGKEPDATLRPGRDAQGHPVATSTVPSQDANDRHRLPTFALWAWKSFLDRFLHFTVPAKVPAAPAPAVAAPASAPPGPGSPGAAPARPAEASSRTSELSAAPVSPNAQTAQPAARSLSKADLERVQKLVDCMEEQARWDWAELKRTYGSSAGIKNAMANGTFNFSVAQKHEQKFTGNCYASVKVGLWRAGYVEGVNSGIAPATDAKGWLEGQGFKDVTETLPDARWAWPGDVIVYEYDAETIKKNDEKIKDALARYEQDRQDYLEKKKGYDKAHAEWTGRQKVGLSMLREGKEGKKDSKDPEPKPPKAPQKPQGENYGHIDVRTYDGYISDAKTLFLPNPRSSNRSSKGMVVIGIYRKISDSSVHGRILAFLKCLREWECHEENNDEKRYYYMYAAINGSRIFKDTSKHPFEGVESNNTPAGAYQIRLKTYKEHVFPKRDIPCEFTPRDTGQACSAAY